MENYKKFIKYKKKEKIIDTETKQMKYKALLIS
jgi:hypothetical protein